MFCPQCGKEHTEKINFCCNCGTAMFTPVMPRKKLARSRTDRKVAGVCGGFADYMDIDPSLIRVAWIMLVFLGGWGLLGYLVAWIIMPEQPLVQPAPVVAPSVAPQPASR